MWYILVVDTYERAIDKSESDKDLSVVFSTGRRVPRVRVVLTIIKHYKSEPSFSLPGNARRLMI